MSAQPSAGLCSESVVVLDPTEDGKRGELLRGRRRQLQFPIPDWNPVDGLARRRAEFVRRPATSERLAGGSCHGRVEGVLQDAVPM